MKKNFLKCFFKSINTKNDLDYDFYRSVEIFDNLSDKEIQNISSLFIKKYYKKNETIYKENHPQVVVYIVKTGKVSLQIDLPHINFKIFEIPAKIHFGEIGLFLDIPRINTAIALEDTELIAMKKSDIMLFIKANPGTGIKLLYNLGKCVASKYIDTSKLIRQNGIFE